MTAYTAYNRATARQHWAKAWSVALYLIAYIYLLD
jgi:hypothetical protein